MWGSSAREGNCNLVGSISAITLGHHCKNTSLVAAQPGAASKGVASPHGVWTSTPAFSASDSMEVLERLEVGAVVVELRLERRERSESSELSLSEHVSLADPNRRRMLGLLFKKIRLSLAFVLFELAQWSVRGLSADIPRMV